MMDTRYQETEGADVPDDAGSKPGLIHPGAEIGEVALTVAGLERSLAFYQQVLGLQADRRAGATAGLSAGGADLLVLVEDRHAPQPPRYAAGLYHFAVLMPSRKELGRALRRLSASGWPAQGFADHGVSEAVYLADPDGNGIEIYRDRPRSEWPLRNGQLQMTSDPLDLEGVLAEVNEEDPAIPASPETQMGHIHLKVTSIPTAEAFYCQILGFELMQRFGASAGFVSAGGYHHHIGFNVWESSGGPARPPGSLGLRHFTVRLPGEAALAPVLARVRSAGLLTEGDSTGFLVQDPFGNTVRLSIA